MLQNVKIRLLSGKQNWLNYWFQGTRIKNSSWALQFTEPNNTQGKKPVLETWVSTSQESKPSGQSFDPTLTNVNEGRSLVYRILHKFSEDVSFFEHSLAKREIVKTMWIMTLTKFQSVQFFCGKKTVAYWWIFNSQLFMEAWWKQNNQEIIKTYVRNSPICQWRGWILCWIG